MIPKKISENIYGVLALILSAAAIVFTLIDYNLGDLILAGFVIFIFYIKQDLEDIKRGLKIE